MAQFNVNLAFNADTGKAKAQIQELQSLLSKIAYTGTTSPTKGLQTDLQAASAAAKELQFHLNNAFNASTGNFDLSMLDRSLKTSGSNVTDLSMKLLNAGTTGQQAFVKLAQSISLADQPMFRISKRMQEFAVTMKNTVKWQLSSSMLHGFMGAVQSAYGYAQDLNKSLNDIRIVTGYNTDRMAKFAEQANKAAKALSTTTTDYTNASLIYFQQGLNDAEVAARTDITVKMANAVGQSAEVISEQLTAIWNNFADGSKSLEYYADVMAALGAATASSSDEISEGLSKFAAVAGSVGLSYEYATSALATLTSNTRESADVVGNSLKTLFARIQGLQLGETLDDGTDLNKYSQALEKVGISIYDANGGLKDMDNILDEMAAKWNTLSDTQQVALAQTVAGVRQYNQLIALMENWNNGDNDSMIANLQTAKDSEGSLQKQADIYAESWEAAEKRVQAAAEGIYQSLLDDDFFISLTNGFANVLNGIDAFIDGAGGIKTVLIGIASIITTTFAHKIPDVLDNFVYNLEFMTKGVNSAYSRIQKQMNDATQDTFAEFNKTAGKNGIKEDSSMGYAIKSANELTAARNKLALVSDRMSSAEKQMAETSLSLIQKQQEEVIALKQKNEQLQESINLQKKQIQTQGISDSTKSSALSQNNNLSETFDIITDELESDQKKLKGTRSGKIKAEINERVQAYQEGLAQIKTFSKALHEEIDSINEGYDILGQQILDKYLSKDFQQNKEKYSMSIFGDLDFENGTSGLEKMVSQIDIFIQKKESMSNPQNFQAAKDEIAALGSTIPPVIQEATGLDVIFRKIADNKLTSTTEELQTNFDELKDKLKSATINGQDFEKVLKKLYGKSIDQLVNDMQLLANNEEKAAQKAGVLKNLLNEFNPQHVVRTSEALGALAGMAGSAVTAINGIISIFKSWTNPDLSGWEKVSATLSGFAMITPGVISIIRNWATSLAWVNTQMVTSTASAWLYNAATVALGGVITKETAAELMRIAVTEKAKGTDQEAIRVKLLAALANNTALTAAQKDIIVKFAQNAATKGLTMATWELITAWIAANAVTLGWVAVIGILIAALVAMGVAAYNAYNADALAAEQANKQVELLTENYNKLKEAADSFKEAVSNYDEAIKALDGLDTKTKEYADALEKANEEARNLIETYGLYDDFTYENGLITIDEDALAAAQAERDQVARQAQNELYASRIGANNMNLNSQATNLVRKENLPLSRDELLGLAEVINEISESNGGVQLSAEKLNAALSNNTSLLTKHGLTLNDLSNVITEDTIDSLYSFSESLDEAADANIYYAGQILGNHRDDYYGDTTTEAATDSQGNVDYNQKALMDAAIDTIVESKAEEEGNGLRSSRQEAAAQEALYNNFVKNTTGYDAANDYENLAESTVSKYLHGASLESVYGTMFKGASYDGNINTQEMLYDYLRAQGYTNISIDDKANGTNDVTYTDTSGKVVTANYTNDAAQQMWGQHISDYILDTTYKEQLDNTFSTEDADALLNNIMSAESQYGVSGEQWGNLLLSSIANNNGETLDFSSIFSQLDPSEIEQLRNLTDEEKLNLFGLSSADWEALGLTSAAQFGEAFDSALEDYSVKSYTDAINSKYENLAESYDIDLDEYKAYRDLLAETNASLKDQPELLNKIALRQKRLQKGVKSLSDNWEDFNEAMSSGDIAKISEVLPEVNDALKDMLDLTDEEFEGLSPDFAVKNWELIQDYMNGVEGSYERIQTAAAAEIIFGASYDLDGLQNSEQAIIDEMLSFQAEHGDLEIGATINTSEALSGLWDLYDSGKKTIGQLQEAFNSLGWEPEIEYVPVDAETAAAMRSAGYQEYAVMNADGSMSIHSVPLDGELVQSSDQQYYIPKIKSKNATNTGGSRPPSPPGHTDKGKGGGGGSKTKKETKQRDDEVERYHVVKEQMEELEKQAEKLSKAKDQAFGRGKLDLIEKEIELLDEQIKKQDEYLKQIQKYGEEDKALMIVYGAQFDENGVITNYEQLMDQELAKYNKAVEQYNKNHDEKKFAAAEARYEKFLNDMEQYEETMDEWDKAQAARADMLREIYDLKFEALTYEIEVDIDLEEDDLKLLDYYLEKLDDDAFSAAESITLLGKKTQDLLDQSKIYSDGITDLLSLHGLSDERINQYMNGSLTEQELITMGFSDEDIATLREYRDNLLEINKDLSSIREEIYSKIIEAFDAWNEKITDNIDKIEKLNKVLNSYQNIIDIVGVNTLKIDDKFMKNLSNAIVDNSKKVLDASVKKYHSLQEAQLQAQQEYEKSLIEGNEETIRYWEETLEHINNEVQNAEQEMMDSWQDALQAAADAFDKSVENIMDNFEKALSGSFGNLDNLSEMFEQRTEIADRYLDDYEKIYQLSKLNRDINNSIDDTDSIKAKKILKSLQEEINELQNSEQEMSQYDLEYLQKRYELKLAEIALEEAQNAKSTVRLMQDSEGNWSYVYTNDQEKISDAQQRYEDALFDMQVANEDYIQDLQEKALDAQKAMTEAIKSIDKTQFATEDAYKERIDQIREYYMDQQNYYYDEMAKALDNNKELYENDWLNYSNLTNYKISSDKEYVDNFAETTYAQIMGYSTIEEAQNNFIMATDIMVEEIIESYTLWLSNINEIMDLAGTSIDTFASDTENNLDRINTKTNEVADSIDDLSQEIVNDFDYIIDTVSDWEDNYVNAIDTTIQANEDMYDSCNSLIGMLNNVDISISNTGKNFSSTAQQIAKAAADIAAAAQRAADAASNIGSNVPGGGSPIVDKDFNKDPQNNNTGGSSFVEIPLYASPSGGFKLKVKVYKSSIKKLDDPYPNFTYGYFLDQHSGQDGYITKSDYDKLKKLFFTSPGGGGGGKFAYDILKMDTGGYTGDWGSDGKIAMLHQKELVLNAEDTQNMLNAVNIVREIARVIDLNAGIQSLGLYLQNLSHLSSGIGNSGIQQSIQITAEFPDAVYHSEIEEAFKTLLNESSQYISREK